MKVNPTCGALTRRGTPCQCKPLKPGGRCGLHGGLSTGPKTPEGKARSARNLAIPKQPIPPTLAQTLVLR
jgi:hypothetical protein